MTSRNDFGLMDKVTVAKFKMRKDTGINEIC